MMIKPEQIEVMVGNYFFLPEPRPFLEAHILKHSRGKSALRKIIESSSFEMDGVNRNQAMAILEGKENPKSWITTFRPKWKAIFHQWLNHSREHIGRINLPAAENQLDSLLKGKDPKIAEECIRQCLPEELKGEFQEWGFEIRGIFSQWSPLPRMIFAFKRQGVFIRKFSSAFGAA